jgi:chitodextrinase
LTWIDPADSDLVSVEITWPPGGTQTVTVSKGVQTVNITGLTNKTEYIFTVVAVDAVGNRSAGAFAGPLTPDSVLVGIDKIVEYLIAISDGGGD